MTCVSNAQQWSVFVSLGLRVYLQLRQVGVICHGGLIQDERLPYMVQTQGKSSPGLCTGEEQKPEPRTINTSAE